MKARFVEARQEKTNVFIRFKIRELLFVFLASFEFEMTRKLKKRPLRSKSLSFIATKDLQKVCLAGRRPFLC